MKKTFLLVLLIASSSTTLLAQATGNSNHGRGDYIAERGIDLHVPDPFYIDHSPPKKETALPVNNKVRTQYVAVLTISQQSSSAGSAEQKLNQKLNQYYRSLNNLGIPRTDIQDEFVSLQPTYTLDVIQQGNLPVAKRTHTGFEMKKTIRVTFYDYNRLQSILVRAADLKIYQLDQVEHLLTTH